MGVFSLSVKLYIENLDKWMNNTGGNLTKLSDLVDIVSADEDLLPSDVDDDFFDLPNLNSPFFCTNTG